MESNATKFLERFAGLMRAHGTYIVQGAKSAKNKMTGKARTLNEPVTRELWQAHLDGTLGIGIVPINDAAVCRFGAIDIDQYDGLDLLAIDKKLNEFQFPLVVCRTKSGGAHLYLFTSKPVSAELVRGKLMEWAVALGFPGVEIFPKQTRLASNTDIGNWINMPYFNANNTERFAVKAGRPLSADEFLDYAKEKTVDESTLKEITVKQNKLLLDAPPCLEHLARVGFPEGSRNNGLLNLGVYAKKVHGDNWELKLDELNTALMNPPLTSEEVLGVAKSLRKKDYLYKCKDQPICDSCNRSICVTRKFGIAGDSDNPGVDLNGLTKIDTKPPTWIVQVDGVRIEINDTSSLLLQDRFRLLCVEHLNKLPTRVKQNRWDMFVNELLGHVEIIEAPEDAGTEGQFLILVEQFCVERSQARNSEELILGKPWTDEGRIYFRSLDLMKFLEHNRFREVETSKKAWAILRKAGAEHSQLNVKSKCIKVWSIPVALFTKVEGELEVFRIQNTESF